MKLSRTILYTLTSALALGAAAMADDGCSKDNPYPPSMVASFMKGCASKAELKDFCQCTINTLQKNMSLYEFVEVGNSSSTGLQKDPRFTEATNNCLSKLKVTSAQ